MLDFSTYLAARHLTREAAHEALPNATVRPHRVTIGRRRTPCQSARGHTTVCAPASFRSGGITRSATTPK
jgi:hypothetical protein